MKRDMTTARDILLEIEGADKCEVNSGKTVTQSTHWQRVKTVADDAHA